MYTPITDFRGGLDSRKMSLALPAGTLIQCDNAHINQGAEIEKRKAFVQNAVPYSTAFPTFGACATPFGITIFGSGSLAAGIAPNSVTPGAYPAPMQYQQLIHPAVLAGTAYAQASHAMTAAVYSCLWGNFPFVIAKYADGGIYCYYNGALVADYTSGVVLNYLAGNNTGLATAIAALINNTNGYTAASSGSSLDVFSNPGNSYQVTVVVQGISNITVTSGGSQNYPTATVENDTGNNCPDGSAIVIGGQAYRFKNIMAAAYDVQIAQTYTLTMTNLYLAINAKGTAGTNYFAGTAANPNVSASLFVMNPNPSFTLTALALNNPGVIQNTISGTSLLETSPTINKTTGAQSQGQFRIVAGNASASASGTVTTSGSNPANGSTIAIAGKTYRFEATMSAINDVKVAATGALTLFNLYLAINGTGVAGTNYFAGTTPNTNVFAPSLVGNTFTVQAIAAGTAGNALTMALSGTTNLTLSAATLTGGNSSNISAVTVGPVTASGTISSNGVNPADGDTFTIGATTYRFKNVLAAESDVKIGLRVVDTIQNLIEAVNLSGTNLVNYQVTTLNNQVTAIATVTGGVIRIVARAPGAAGNAIGMSSSTAKLVPAATLTGGSDSVALISTAVQWAPGQTISQFANSLVAAINISTATTGFYAMNSSQTIYIYSKALNSLADNAVVSVTALGVAIGFCGINFSISRKGAISGGEIAKITVSAIDNIMQGAVTLSTFPTIPQLVAGAADSINTNTAAGPDGVTPINQIYLAVAQGSALYLSNVVTTSNDQFQTVTVVTDSTTAPIVGVSSIGNNSLIASITPSFIGFTRINNVTAENSPIVATCEATGGYPPYSYSWQYQSGDSAFTVQDSTKQNVTFARQDSAGSSTTVWACVVTDSIGDTATSNTVTVSQP